MPHSKSVSTDDSSLERTIRPSSRPVKEIGEERPRGEAGFTDRLKGAMNLMSQAELARLSGVSKSGLSQIVNGGEPSLFTAAKLANALDVSLDWLVNGVGLPSVRASGFSGAPVLDVRLAAGAATFAEAVRQVGWMPFDNELLYFLGVRSTEGLVICTVEGDSMEPLIADGARVLVDTRDTRLREDIFAFRIGDELRIKRLVRRGVDEIEILSENPRYEPQTLSGEQLEHFAILGRALWAATPL